LAQTLARYGNARRGTSSRDFVHWRFSDAGHCSAWIASSCRRPKTCTEAEVALIRAARLAPILLRIARDLQYADKGPARLRDWTPVARDSVAAAEPPPYVLAPGVRPLHCLRRRCVVQIDCLDCPAMPLPPTMPLRHSGPGRNVRARSRFAFLLPADQVGSSAWHARSARSQILARRASSLPSRRKKMPRLIGIEHERAID
jgi:hypothetical protein